MKKTFLLGITFGIASLAHATSVSFSTYTLPTGDSIDGYYAYWYKLTATDLGVTAGQSISDVSLNFNDIELTTYGQETLHADLINGKYSSGKSGDYDNPSDYFTTYSFKHYHSALVDSIGEKTDLDPLVSTSWSWDITGGTLTDLNNDLASLGAFDIGIDPDCHYSIGSITLTYKVTSPSSSVPDSGTTVTLLGIGFLGLLVYRHKLALS